MSTNVTITTYADLERWVDAFLKPDGLRLLFLVGNPGTGKSVSFEAKLDKDTHHYIKAARLTPFQLYKQLYVARNKGIILDDVDDPLRRSDMARLLMAVCETDDRARTVAWLGTESKLKVHQGNKTIIVPQEFRTTSRVCIICNDWDILTNRFRALLDRGAVVFFDPGATELHCFVGRWFKDPEIHAFVGEHLADISRHSMRYYVNAAELKRQDLDWRAALMESWTSEQPRGNATEELVQRLLADPNFKTDKERIEAFTADPKGGCRRTWFNIKKKLGLNAKTKPGV